MTLVKVCYYILFSHPLNSPNICNLINQMNVQAWRICIQLIALWTFGSLLQHCKKFTIFYRIIMFLFFFLHPMIHISPRWFNKFFLDPYCRSLIFLSNLCLDLPSEASYMELFILYRSNLKMKLARDWNLVLGLEGIWNLCFISY